MRGIQSHVTVQHMLMTFVDNAVDLVIAHDELTTFQSSEYATRFKVDCRSSSISLSGSSTTSSNDSFRINGAKQQPQQQRTAQKRLSFSNSSIVSTDDCIEQIVNATNIHVNGTISAESFNQKNEQTEDIHTTLTRRASLNKSLAMTPLYNSTEYIPVYANRVTITNTISDDEKWQILSRKRSDQLTKTGYTQHLPEVTTEDVTKYGQHTNNSSKAHNMMSNNAMYALCRPHSYHQIASAQDFERTSRCVPVDDSNTTITFHNPQYRSIKINKELYGNGSVAYVGDQPSVTSNFGIQKSQTESCLAMTNNSGTEPLFVQNRVSGGGGGAAVKKLRRDIEDNAKCDTTISIQINQEGESFVEGKFFFFPMLTKLFLTYSYAFWLTFL